MNYCSSKSAEMVFSKAISYVKNWWNFFKKKIIYEIQFSRPFFLKKTFFLTSIFFSKIIPNLWQTGAPRILKIQCFPLSTYVYWCLAKNLAFQDPPPLKFHNQTDINVPSLIELSKSFLVGLKCIQVINPSSETKGTKAWGPKTVSKSLLNLKKYFHFRPFFKKSTNYYLLTF